MKSIPFNFRAFPVLVTSLLISLAGCSGYNAPVNGSNTSLTSTTQLSLSASTIKVGHPIHIQVNPDSLIQKLELTAELNAPYAILSIYSGNTVLADNINIPNQGLNTINLLLAFDKTGQQPLTFAARGATINIQSANLTSIDSQLANFNDISAQVGLETEETYKYGGPAIADFGNDGDYDFALNNHNFIPTQLVENFNG